MTTTTNIVYGVLKYLAPVGMKAGRYIYIEPWCRQVVFLIAEEQGVDMEETAKLYPEIKAELMSAWQNLINC